MSKQYGKGSKSRPFSVNYEDFCNRWEDAFGKGRKDSMKKSSVEKTEQTSSVVKKPGRQKTSSVAKKPARRKSKFQLCPHCATNYLKRKNSFTAVCKRCGWTE
jgi:ribosomal protein L37AE/L43A